MIDLPLVTVYMPTHNRQALLIRAVNSVLRQNYPNIELIIVDDGSTDDTWSLLNEFSNKYTNIRIMKHAVPLGACAARNSAINLANGYFITGLDDDDEFLPDHLVKLTNYWNSKYAAIAASLLNDKGNARVKQGREYGVISLSSLMHYNRIGNQVFTLTSRLKAIGGFDVMLPAFQDYDCWVRLSQKYGPIFKTKEHSYVLHTSHEQERISSNMLNRLRALKMFEVKHQDLLSKEHKKSIRLVEARIQGKLLSWKDVLSSFNFGNWRLIAFVMLSSFRKD